MIDLDKMAAEARARLRQHINRSAAAHLRVMRKEFRKLRDIEPDMLDREVVSNDNN